MKNMMKKAKVQWCILGIVGSSIAILNVNHIPLVSAGEADGLVVTGTAVEMESSIEMEPSVEMKLPIEIELPVEKEGEYVQIVSTRDVNYYATVNRGTDGINTQPWGTLGYETIGYSSAYLGNEVSVSQEQVADNGVTWAFVSFDGQELGWIAKDALNIIKYINVLSTTVVDYPATIERGTDGINTRPWGTRGYETIDYSYSYLGKEVTISQEQETDNGVTWALASLNGKELGWIAKDALRAGHYIQVISTTIVDYPATIERGTDGINTQPWGTKGYRTNGYSSDYLGKEVTVSEEQQTDNGVTWALVSYKGQELGWIAKEALNAKTYVQVLSKTVVDYPATIIRDTDGINTQPWGTKEYKTIGQSSDYYWKEVTVSQEQLVDNGLTWALISVNGKELGWIVKDALWTRKYTQTKSTVDVDYPATIIRETDSINTAPWGVKGYTTIDSASHYFWAEVTVSQEQLMDNGVTWVLISVDGKQVGWITKDALWTRKYTQIKETRNVSYEATIIRKDDAVNTAPWGVKGYQTIGNSSDYQWKTVTVSQEQVTDDGTTWALVSLYGQKLGWVAKDVFYDNVVSTRNVNYEAIVNRGTDGINTAPWGIKGYTTTGHSSDYLWQNVKVTQEKVTSSGVTWALISLNGRELGWIAKDALSVLTVTGPDWSIQNGYFKTNTGINYYVGSNYIIVSIEHQRLWAYKGTTKIVDTPIITGNPFTGNATPRGLYAIQPFKQSPSVLVGADYASPVSYWIPFIGNSYGLHDSSWQTNGYGGDLYLRYGSHGCVNTPLGAVETLYYAYSAGTPVVVY